ncbi:MAG: DUF5615 family PIN-like protein [Anaerolineae bacterium]|nr:DUF5615 family PIN-like protein [Anaerolineae bacterium]
MSHLLPKFYLDSHISKEAAIQLRRKGIDAIHCAELGKQDDSDEAHLVFSTEQGRIMVSCDKRIEQQLHFAWLEQGREHAGIIFVQNEDCEGERGISVIVRELIFLCEAVQEGACSVEDDLYNQFWRV